MRAGVTTKPSCATLSPRWRPRMSELDLDAEAALHYAAPWPFADAPAEAPHPCYGCGHAWPCKTSLLLAEARRLRAVAGGALALAAQGRYLVCTENSLSDMQGRDTPAYKRLGGARGGGRGVPRPGPASRVARGGQ